MNRGGSHNSHEKRAASWAAVHGARRLREKGLRLESIRRRRWSLNGIFSVPKITAYWVESHHFGPGLVSSVKLALLTAEVM